MQRRVTKHLQCWHTLTYLVTTWRLCTGVRACVCVYKYVHVRDYFYECVRASVLVSLRACVSVCVYIRACLRVCVYTCVSVSVCVVGRVWTRNRHQTRWPDRKGTSQQSRGVTRGCVCVYRLPPPPSPPVIHRLLRHLTPYLYTVYCSSPLLPSPACRFFLTRPLSVCGTIMSDKFSRFPSNKHN